MGPGLLFPCFLEVQLGGKDANAYVVFLLLFLTCFFLLGNYSLLSYSVPADLGAEVVKIEPPSGDLTRFATPRRNGLSSYFVQQNTGKRNVSIDLAVPAGVEVLLDLVEHADVLVENCRPGVMDKLGLGPDVALARNPQLIYASISGYGQTGPWVGRRPARR